MAPARSLRKPPTGSRSFRARKRSTSSGLSSNTLVLQSTQTDNLFKDPQPVSIFHSPSNELRWYHPWLYSQVTTIPHAVRQLRSGEETLLENNTFERVFATAATFVQDNEGISIDDVVEHLRITQRMEATPESFKAQRLLVFAILGWQSMLYRAAFNICSADELAVRQHDDQSSSGFVFDTNKVSANLADRPLFVILKAFGNLLPSSPSNVTQLASESSKTAATWLPLDPTETNAYHLHTLLHVRLRWVDSLALHLDYNKSSRTLCLFSYPSFCVAMLRSRGTVFSFASTEKNSFDPRGSQEDISQFMREVLLSFRLLFGQHKLSRKLFPLIYRPTEPLQEPDQLLPVLCMTKYIQRSEPLPISVDQPVYFAAQHFPVLSERIEIIANELKNSRPTSIAELLRDRRDTLQFYTFWLVSIIGGTGVILSLVQVVLQAIQLARN